MDAKAIGRRLVQLRGLKTGDEVSKALGISRSALCMYEKGERIPRDQIKIRLAEYYGTTVQELFFDD